MTSTKGLLLGKIESGVKIWDFLIGLTLIGSALFLKKFSVAC